MNKTWFVVLSDGTTWELVSPGIRLYSIEDGEVADIGDRLRELTTRQEGIALVDLLALFIRRKEIVAQYRNDPGSAYSLSVQLLRELLTEAGEPPVLIAALGASKAHYGDWSFEERIVAHLGEKGVELSRRSFEAHKVLTELVGKAGFEVLDAAISARTELECAREAAIVELLGGTSERGGEE